MIGYKSLQTASLSLTLASTWVTVNQNISASSLCVSVSEAWISQALSINMRAEQSVQRP